MAGIAAVETILGYSNLVRDIDYVGINRAGGIDDLIYINEPQLLITGIISDAPSDVADMVKRLRRKNVHLVVVAYTSIESLQGDFDLMIAKATRNAASLLTSAIVDFREGRLRRN